MKRSNLIPITRIYDIYPKYTYSEDVKKFMDEIVDIDRASVYTKDEVIAIFAKLQTEIKEYTANIDNAISEDELKIEGMKVAYTNCLEIIDKYKAESEV